MQNNANSTSTVDTSLEIAVIGGGIVGLMVAIGLLKRGIKVTVFERAEELTEVSAGFAFTGVARECMKRLDPRLLEILHRIGEVNRNSHNRYWDGHTPTTKEVAESRESLLFELSARDLDYQGCLRSHLLHEMAGILPKGTIQLGKELQDLTDHTSCEKVTLRFTDGTIHGFDGGEDNLASHPQFSHKIAYRAIIPIENAKVALGEEKAMNQCIHMGPDVAVVTYPVAQWTLFNVAIFAHELAPWTNRNMTATATKAEVKSHVSDWSPSVRDLAEALPETINKWALFDTADHPAPTYVQGRVCIAGDAAHASTPFLGAGACMGVEDALVLATVLDLATEHTDEESVHDKAKSISAALSAYDSVRRERSQWLVRGSRDIGDLYQWRNRSTGREVSKCEAELRRHQKEIWDFNVNDMVAAAGYTFLQLLDG
ncbi:salicylate 1-monooxygenase [Fusarium avenaceum]|nr:salicylate 1-monooxygenase [Fusarium avenaceum]